MIRKVTLVTLLALLVATSAWAGFINGGFESGDFTGWTQGAGPATFSAWGGYPPDASRYLPGAVSYNISYNKSGIVTPGLDPLTGNQLNMVYAGNYAARVNDSSPNYHLSVISQRVNNWTDNHIFFAWAAVLQASHGATDSDNFTLQLRDNTAGDLVYNVAYNSFTNGPIFHRYSDWYWTNWQVEDLDVSARIGHDFTLTLLGSDCPYGAHGGYVYLDGFGRVIPPQTPIPGSLLLLGSGLLGLIGIGRRRLS